MDDVFFGEKPELVSTVVALEPPRVVRVRVHMPEDVERAVPVASATVQKPIPDEATVPETATSALFPSSVADAPIPDEEVSMSNLAEEEHGVVVEIPAVATEDVVATTQTEDVWADLQRELAEEDARAERLAFRSEALRRDTRAEVLAYLRLQPSPAATGVHRRTEPSRREERSGESRPVSPRPTKRVHPRLTTPSGLVLDIESPRWKPAFPVFSSPAAAAPEEWLRPAPARKRRSRVRRAPRWPDRANITEALRVAVGTVVIGFLVGTLGSLRAVPRVTRVVGDAAGSGTEHLVAGVKRLAAADVFAGQDELNKATALFGRAEQDLLSSTTLAVRLVGYLDPQERYASGRKLLEAGKILAALGADAVPLVALFRGEESKADSLTDTLEGAFPLVQRLAAGLGSADTLVRDIPSRAVPRERRDDLRALQEGVHALAAATQGFVDSHDVLLNILGARRDQQYLLLFQNNREIRPTGGFIGSFALVDVSRGEVKKVQVDTIYNPDGQLREYLIPPEPLRKITDRWYSRDANWFADFRSSAQKVSTLFERSGGGTVDGVIAVTPTVLERLLRVSGPIPMPAYGITVTAENIVDETQRLTTFEYDKALNAPKAFVADLLPELLDRVTHLPRERWGDLVSLLNDSLREKHVLVFLREVGAQEKVEQLKWAGAVEATDGDYLLRVEANVGGDKTDGLMDQSVDYNVTIDPDGSAVATLVTTRYHEGSRDGRPEWNPDEDWYRKPNVVYERTLVPPGSVLLSARGFTPEGDVPTPYVNTADYRTYVQDPDLAALEEGSSTDASGTVVSVEEGKTSLGNWIVTPPGETTVTVYRYRLPISYDLRTVLTQPFRYSLLLQHQPGHRPVHTKAALRVPPGFRVAWAGPEGGVTHDGERTSTFTAEVSRDSVWGVVAEPL